jgi:hypothetical protein
LAVNADNLLPDGHWSSPGHAAVAKALLKAFAE